MRAGEVRVMSEVQYVSVSINDVTAIRSRDGSVTIAGGDDCDEVAWADSTDEIRAVLSALDAAVQIVDSKHKAF